jgi:hypothetical protein
MTRADMFLLAIPLLGMAVSYVAFRLVRREQKQWHAAQRRLEGPAE